MNTTNLRILLSSALFATTLLATTTPAATITVQADQPGPKIPPTLWGIFFEDINLSADGGIYPELVRNRSFEDSDKVENWTFAKVGENHSEATIDTSRPLNALNKRSLRLKLDGAITLENHGYYGMGVAKGETYTFKAALRGDNFSGPITVKLLSHDGRELASGEIRYIGEAWKYQSVELTAAESDAKGKLQITASGKGAVFLDMVSVLPKKTWKGHGLRPDLAAAMDALKPTVFRFPGGCWVEGETLEKMYDWKKTIGNVDVRTPLWNIWQYYATHSIGYHEYLQMAEDLGAEPLFCINVGMSHKEVVPLDQMGQWVQDALDAIEYANGPTNSFWGGLRAKNGHPAFNLKFLEIGNENGTPAYNERWALFYNAIKAKYPYIQLVANEWQGNIPKSPKPDLVDEHYYNTPEFFMQQAHRYDSYDRTGPKIFVGEYAVTRNTGKGNLRGAIGEAAFMTGMERNADIVAMAAYAPLFCNANHKRWPVNLINFDSTRWFGIPSYYVQKLFSEHRGDTVLPTQVEVGEVQEPPPTGGIGVGTWNTAAEFKDIVVTAPDGQVLFTSDFSQNSAGWKLLGDGAQWSVQDGALRQTAEKEFIRAIVGDKSWTDYTLTLKARKISGDEGFLILFHIADDEDRTWWNIAGWNNTRHGVELGETLDGKSGRVETGYRWYDIKVEVKGNTVKCSLDGKIIHDLKNTLASTRAVFASAVQDSKAGEIIVKVVNTAASPMETEINLAGANKLAASAEAIVLTSASPKDENTLDEPTKVAPKSATIPVSGTKIKHAFPGNSFTVIRVKNAK